MRTDHERLRLDLGAYLIGSLAPAERSALDRHLAGCAQCHAELAALAPLPGLLGRLCAEEARNGVLTPRAVLLPRTLDAVRARQRDERRRLLRWRAAAAAAVVAAVVLSVPALASLSADPARPAGTALVTAAGVAASGTGVLDAKAWGTEIELDVAGLPPAPAYVAFALARDGRGEVAASWGSTPQGRVVVTGATAITRGDLAAVQIRTADGRALLTLPG